MIVPLDITTSTDTNGKPIVLLPLKKRTRKVIVDPESFKELMNMGIKLPLLMREGFPSVHSMKDGKRKYIRIARLIAGAGPSERVLYADRDRLNLTKTNLIISRGGLAKENERDEITPKDIQYQITHKHIPGRVTLN